MKQRTISFLLRTFCFLLCMGFLRHPVHAQVTDGQAHNKTHYALGFALGQTFEANTDFPETDLFKELEFSLFWDNDHNQSAWARNLWHANTGLGLSFSDFGNTEALGHAISLFSFLEFDLSQKKKRLQFKAGAGAGYFTKLFDAFDNPFNKGISTRLNLSFRAHMNYVFAETQHMSWRTGIGLIHYSNGHNRLPNQGLNVLALQVSGTFMGAKDRLLPKTDLPKPKGAFDKAYFYDFRAGLGQNVLSRIFNDKKEVYSLAFSIGKISKNTFKLGAGFHYRFYQHYYDYIVNNEELVQERFAGFKDRPFWNASNFGINFSGELLMGHIGAELEIGVNIHKPGYKIDWILNDGFTFLSGDELVTVFGELRTYFRIKRAFPARLGLKYYLINNNKQPKNNFYIGAHINANLGQADFTEISFGYIKRLPFKENSKKTE